MLIKHNKGLIANAWKTHEFQNGDKPCSPLENEALKTALKNAEKRNIMRQKQSHWILLKIFAITFYKAIRFIFAQCW